MTVRATDAARYLCEISGWHLSNLALQKILYMADMNYIGRYGSRLIDEDFEAWDYGPVLPSLYHRCKAFGAKSVPNVFWGSQDLNNTSEADMLASAWSHLKGMTPGQLVQNTHWERGAWAKHYVPGEKGRIIPSADMAAEYNARTQAG